MLLVLLLDRHLPRHISQFKIICGSRTYLTENGKILISFSRNQQATVVTDGGQNRSRSQTVRKISLIFFEIYIFIYHDLSCRYIYLCILFVYVYLISQDMNLEHTQTPDDMLKLRPEIEELVADNDLIAVIACRKSWS